MTENPSANLLMFDGPARYRIRVQGRLSRSWLDRLEGMSITLKTPTEGPVVSSLEGELIDQAALLGILNWLYELHLPVLSVVCLSCRPVSRSSNKKVKQKSSH